MAGKLGMIQLGFFNSISYMKVVGNTASSAIGLVATPKWAKLFNENKFAEFNKLTYILAAGMAILGGIIILCVIFFGETILVLLYTAEFADYHTIFILIMIGATFDYIGSVFGYALTSTRVYKVLPYLNGTYLLSNLLFSIMLMSKHGVVGLCYALLLSSFINVLMNAVVLSLILHRRRISEVIV